MKTVEIRWITPKRFLDEFNFSISLQAKLRKQSKIPFSKIGGKVLYDRLEINKWIEDHAVSDGSKHEY